MTIQQLEYILAVNRQRHFVKAAEECHVSQPTLSAMIQKLEEELDVKIFDRSKHPVEPTSIGASIIAQAQTTLNDLNRVRELVETEINTLSGSLNIGIIPTVAPYLIPQFISKFSKSFPDVHLRISEMRNNALIEDLQCSGLDMAIMTTPLNNSQLLEIPLYYEKFVAYVSPSCHLKDNNLKASAMPEEDLWVLQESQCILHGRQEFNFCKSKIANHLYEAGSIDTLVRIVDQNGGYTVIPEMHVKFLTDQQKNNLREITNPEVSREISLVIRHDYIKERMLNAVADTVKKIIPDNMIDARLKKFAIKI